MSRRKIVAPRIPTVTLRECHLFVLPHVSRPQLTKTTHTFANFPLFLLYADQQPANKLCDPRSISRIPHVCRRRSRGPNLNRASAWADWSLISRLSQTHQHGPTRFVPPRVPSRSQSQRSTCRASSRRRKETTMATATATEASYALRNKLAAFHVDYFRTP